MIGNSIIELGPIHAKAITGWGEGVGSFILGPVLGFDGGWWLLIGPHTGLRLGPCTG